MDIEKFISEENVCVSVSLPDLLSFAERIADKIYEKCEAKKAAKEEDDKLIPQAEAAKMLHISTNALWRWDKEGYLVKHKVGRHVLYRLGDIRALIAERDA